MHWKIAIETLILLGAATSSASSTAGAIDAATLDRAVRANVTLYNPGDDIMNDFVVHDVRVVDLDSDGTGEILYRVTATCNAANFDCTNQIVVLSAIDEASDKANQPNLFDPEIEAVRKSGYDLADAAQIPGEVDSMTIAGNQVSVRFDVKQDSPICERSHWGNEGLKPTTHCPEPGRHEWVYAWTLGKLKRVSAP
jgi:hypothetical protein